MHRGARGVQLRGRHGWRRGVVRSRPRGHTASEAAGLDVMQLRGRPGGGPPRGAFLCVARSRGPWRVTRRGGGARNGAVRVAAGGADRDRVVAAAGGACESVPLVLGMPRWVVRWAAPDGAGLGDVQLVCSGGEAPRGTRATRAASATVARAAHFALAGCARLAARAAFAACALCAKLAACTALLTRPRGTCGRHRGAEALGWQVVAPGIAALG